MRCSVPKQQRNDSTDALVPPERVPAADARDRHHQPPTTSSSSPCCSRSRDHSTFTRPWIAACCGHAVQDTRHSVRAPVGSHNNQLGGGYGKHLLLPFDSLLLLLLFDSLLLTILPKCSNFLFPFFCLSSLPFFLLLLLFAVSRCDHHINGPGYNHGLSGVFSCSNLRP